nr:MAG TPA: hypothetical protein [Caudoviricetes sp.]
MQSNTKLTDTSKTTVKEAIVNHENNIQALYSGNSGTSFPSDAVAGTHCYRTDESQEYIYDGSKWVSIESSMKNKADKATTLSGYGITDAYTSTEVDAKIKSAIAAIANYDTTAF